MVYSDFCIYTTSTSFIQGYLPATLDRRDLTLERKRQEYFGFLEQYFGTRHETQYQGIFRQIHMDVPRMNPLIPLFQNKLVQEVCAFTNIVYCNSLTIQIMMECTIPILLSKLFSCRIIFSIISKQLCAHRGELQTLEYQ